MILLMTIPAMLLDNYLEIFIKEARKQNVDSKRIRVLEIAAWTFGNRGVGNVIV